MLHQQDWTFHLRQRKRPILERNPFFSKISEQAAQRKQMQITILLWQLVLAKKAGGVRLDDRMWLIWREKTDRHCFYRTQLLTTYSIV
jgi:hypothetical protein